jgi:hypothetical protein
LNYSFLSYENCVYPIVGLQLYRKVEFLNQYPLLQIAAYHVDSTTLADGTYELIPEPEQGISEDQVNVTEELTEAPNQNSGDIDISDPSPTNKGKLQT